MGVMSVVLELSKVLGDELNCVHLVEVKGDVNGRSLVLHLVEEWVLLIYVLSQVTVQQSLHASSFKGQVVHHVHLVELEESFEENLWVWLALYQQ